MSNALISALSGLERSVLEAGLRAPSPHNAQPWRFRRRAPGAYELVYWHADKLLCDPDDRDAFLAIGALLESMELRAGEAGKGMRFEPSFQAVPEGMVVGTFEFGGQAAADPLAAHLQQRRTNRHPYSRASLPRELEAELADLGCVFFDPDQMADLVHRASVLAWKDPNFTRDLKQWTRFRNHADDGMTCRSLRLNLIDQQFLKLALRLGTLPAWLAGLYAMRDVYLTRMSAAIAVLTVEDAQPASLLDAGRRLMRSWLVITARGHASHPMSIVIDQETKHELSDRIDHPHPVAIFRVGRTAKPAENSGRRPLEAVLLE
jgi:nitroreductase